VDAGERLPVQVVQSSELAPEPSIAEQSPPAAPRGNVGFAASALGCPPMPPSSTSVESSAPGRSARRQSRVTAPSDGRPMTADDGPGERTALALNEATSRDIPRVVSANLLLRRAIHGDVHPPIQGSRDRGDCWRPAPQGSGTRKLVRPLTMRKRLPRIKILLSRRPDDESMLSMSYAPSPALQKSDEAMTGRAPHRGCRWLSGRVPSTRVPSTRMRRARRRELAIDAGSSRPPTAPVQRQTSFEGARRRQEIEGMVVPHRATRRGSYAQQGRSLEVRVN